MRTLNFTTGVSDCHNLISTVINSSCPSCEKTKISYRSFRNFDGESFVRDLSQIRLSHLESQTGPQVNNIYNNFEKDVTKVINKHIPVKHKYMKNTQLPYMNRDLRKAIYNKKMFHSKYQKSKTSKKKKKCEDYRKRRNYVNKLKGKSLNNYFMERCIGGSKPADFWKIIKPYMSKKSCKNQTKTVLKENEKLFLMILR